MSVTDYDFHEDYEDAATGLFYRRGAKARVLDDADLKARIEAKANRATNLTRLKSENIARSGERVILPSGDTSGELDRVAIQAAAADATVGVIWLARGHFYIDQTISLARKGLQMVGCGPEQTTLEPVGDTVNAVELSRSYTLLANMSIKADSDTYTGRLINVTQPDSNIYRPRLERLYLQTATDDSGVTTGSGIVYEPSSRGIIQPIAEDIDIWHAETGMWFRTDDGRETEIDLGVPGVFTDNGLFKAIRFTRTSRGLWVERGSNKHRFELVHGKYEASYWTVGESFHLRDEGQSNEYKSCNFFDAGIDRFIEVTVKSQTASLDAHTIGRPYALDDRGFLTRVPTQMDASGNALGRHFAEYETYFHHLTDWTVSLTGDNAAATAQNFFFQGVGATLQTNDQFQFETLTAGAAEVNWGGRLLTNTSQDHHLTWLFNPEGGNTLDHSRIEVGLKASDGSRIILFADKANTANPNWYVKVKKADTGGTTEVDYDTGIALDNGANCLHICWRGKGQNKLDIHINNDLRADTDAKYYLALDAATAPNVPAVGMEPYARVDSGTDTENCLLSVSWFKARCAARQFDIL